MKMKQNVFFKKWETWEDKINDAASNMRIMEEVMLLTAVQTKFNMKIYSWQ